MATDEENTALTESVMTDIDKNRDIPKANKLQARKYIQWLKGARGYRPSTLVKEAYYIQTFLVCLPKKVDMLKASKEDIEYAIGKMREAKNKDGKPFAYETQRHISITIKLFYRHYLGDDEYLPKCCRWLKEAFPSHNTSPLRPEDMVGEEELAKMIRAAQNPRDRAYIHLAGELGLRPFEQLAMKRKDVDLASKVITVTGKKDKVRTCPFVKSFSDVQAYLNTVQLEPDDPLWLTWYGYKPDVERKPLQYDAMVRMMQRVKRAAKITHKWAPYRLRHSAITTFAKEGYSDQLIKQMVGHEPGSAMLQRYSHVGLEALKSKMAEVNGTAPSEVKKSPLKPQICRCGEINGFDSKYCNKCGSALSVKVVLEESRNIERMDVMAQSYIGDPKALEEQVHAYLLEQYKRMKKTK